MSHLNKFYFMKCPEKKISIKLLPSLFQAARFKYLFVGLVVCVYNQTVARPSGFRFPFDSALQERIDILDALLHRKRYLPTCIVI